jgi:hypothetical protein
MQGRERLFGQIFRPDWFFATHRGNMQRRERLFGQISLHTVEICKGERGCSGRYSGRTGSLLHTVEICKGERGCSGRYSGGVWSLAYAGGVGLCCIGVFGMVCGGCWVVLYWGIRDGVRWGFKVVFGKGDRDGR